MIFLASGMGLFLVAALFALWWLNTQLGPQVKVRAERLISERFGGEAHIGSLEVTLRPTPRVVGHSITLRTPLSNQPLIEIEQFTAQTDLATLLGESNHHVSRVTLQGLVISIAPGFKHDAGRQISKSGNGHFPFVIDELVADGTRLLILPKDPAKSPLEFDIRKLSMRSVGVSEPMAFVATIENAKPPGLIEANGHFGPWQKESPRSTPLDGHYSFHNADLSVFKGISGTLSSIGDFRGVLETIDVTGSTDTPDFTVTTGRHPVALHTDFHAIVDGTNGDTTLDPVDAKFLHTQLICRGVVEGEQGTKGKFVKLRVLTSHARMEDLLRLCVRSKKPFLSGATTLDTDFVLPPGKEEVMHKLQLQGNFSIKAAQFSDPKIQDKIGMLSRRSQGQVSAGEEQTVTSDFRGSISLRGGVANLRDLEFAVPGAQVALSGTYNVRSEEIDMHGSARLEAHLSEMTTGFKSALLKLADPFFAKHGAGTFLPIKLAGTRENPSFGLEFGRKDGKPDGGK